ncbi:MAG: hypothetical protein GY798_27290 [Hyphomicrobiales bacterium]|nr:hypothetical protein [Hyphomicrobiales bacterium]
MDGRFLTEAEGAKAARDGIGPISDHFRLPWRFHARIVAARGAGID